MSMPFVVSRIEEEGILHVSKWLKHAVLLERKEMEGLLESLEPCLLVPGTGIVSGSSALITKETFLKEYDRYLELLLTEDKLVSSSFRRFFTLMLSSSLEDFYAIQTGEDRFVIKARRPVIQVQAYHAFISRFDHKIHPMALNEESFSFGLQFSYPQIYEDPKTHVFSKVLLEESFSSSRLFKVLVQWMRKHTKPAALQIGQEITYAPFRVGKETRRELSHHRGLEKALGALCR